MLLVLRQKFEENAIPPVVITGQALEDMSSRDLLVLVMAVAVEEEVEEAAMVVEVDVVVVEEEEEEVARNVLVCFEHLYLLVNLYNQPCNSR
jgi:hypothetical protein